MIAMEEEKSIKEYLANNLKGKETGTIIDDIRTLVEDGSALEMIIDMGASAMDMVLGNAAAPAAGNRSDFPKGLSKEAEKKNRLAGWMKDQKQESESLAAVLEKKLVEKGYTEEHRPKFYKKIDMNRQLFSKVLSRAADSQSQDKKTIYKFLIGLELKLGEAEEVLGAGGYTFNNHKQYDMIIKYCIENGIYDPATVDEYLILFGEKPLFSK